MDSGIIPFLVMVGVLIVAAAIAGHSGQKMVEAQRDAERLTTQSVVLCAENDMLRELLANADERTKRHRAQIAGLVVENHELGLLLNQAYDRGYIPRQMKEGREN